MPSFTRELQTTLRRLGRSPLFTILSILTLALGIGGNSAVFSVLHGVLLEPLPYEEPDRLVGVWHEAPGIGFDQLNQAPALHFTYLDHNRVFEEVGMWDGGSVTLSGTDEPEQVRSMWVTDGTFRALRIQPRLGRIFSAEDDSPGAPPTVLLSHGYWQQEFASSRDVLGQSLVVDGISHEIVGVLPEGMKFLDSDPSIYLPFQFDRSEVRFGNFSYQGLARLKPGKTVEDANEDLRRLIPISLESFPMFAGFTVEMALEARIGPKVHPLKEDVVGDVGQVLWVLLGTVGLVLLLAGANVANLFLVRTEGRRQEMAIRTALGASRGRLTGEFLRETVCLGLLAGGVGLWFAWLGIRVLVTEGPSNLPRIDEIGVTPTVVAFNLGVSILAGLLLGFLPTLRLGDVGLVSTLKDGTRGAGGGRERQRTRDVLVVTQVAMALVVLVGSGLMIRSFLALKDVHPGFERPEEVLTLRVAIPEAEIEDRVQVAQTHEAILRGLAEIPGVESAGASSSITMDGWDSNDPIFVEEFPVEADRIPPVRRFKWVLPGYFETMGNPIQAGRAISWSDLETRAPVVVVSESFAQEYWTRPSDALGKRVRPTPEDPWREIVGVVGAVHDDGVDEEATPVVYWPLLVANSMGDEINVPRSVAFALRSPRVGSESLVEQAREAVWAVNGSLPVARVRTLEEILDRSLARTLFTLVLLGLAAVVALLLGAVGIYGVTSYTVSLRTREIGLRMALGAQRGDVRRMVLRHALTLAVIGVGVGLAVAAGITRWMESLLFGVRAVDPLTYGAVTVGLIVIALLASHLPARRATRVNPIEALHWE